MVLQSGRAERDTSGGNLGVKRTPDARTLAPCSDRSSHDQSLPRSRAAGERDDPQVANPDFAWAQIDIPGPRDLWAVSIHFLTSSATVRLNQAEALATRIQVMVPAGDLLTIAGDFNAQSRGEPLFAALAGVVKTTGPFSADHVGNLQYKRPPAKTLRRYLR